MMTRLWSLLGSAAVIFGVATATYSPTCSPSVKCPSEAPCCSAYGHCGAGAYCLGGCDPMSSFSLQSCMPRPTCRSADYSFDSFKGMVSNTAYLGNATDVNWVAEGIPKIYNDDSIFLTMPPDSVGTLLTSTHYVWYGKISATMKSSAGNGVVTAFIMMSDVKDEIDFEFVGSDLQSAQSNFYWQGVTNYTNEKNLSAANTNTEYHTYTIDWQEEQLTWYVDDVPLRTLKKSSTYNESTGDYNYPQTPARVQLSLWPAGTTKSGKGTVTWAGGLIDWNSPYMLNGYYYAQVKEVTVECADTPSGATVKGTNSYQYMNLDGLQSSVEVTNDNTMLGNMYATGIKPDNQPDQKSGGSSQPKNVETVPGTSGIGARTGSAGGGSNTNSGDASMSSPGAVSHKFYQGLDSAAQKTAATGSAFAVLVAVGVLVMV